MHHVRTLQEMQNRITEKCTSTALVKIAEHNKAFIVSPEAFEVFNKLLKWDEKTQLVMIRFYVSFSERTHKIPPNTVAPRYNEVSRYLKKCLL